MLQTHPLGVPRPPLVGKVSRALRVWAPRLALCSPNKELFRNSLGFHYAKPKRRTRKPGTEQRPTSFLEQRREGRRNRVTKSTLLSVRVVDENCGHIRFDIVDVMKMPLRKSQWESLWRGLSAKLSATYDPLLVATLASGSKVSKSVAPSSTF